MKKLIIFALLAVLSACTNSPNPEVVNRQSSVVSSGDGNFGLVAYSQSPVKSFVFKNSGSVAVSGSPILTGTGFDLALQLGCETIEPGKNCLVKIQFNSINKESGIYSSTLKVGDSNLNLSATIDSVPTPNYVFSVNGEVVGTSGLSLGDLSGKNIKLITVKIKNSSPKSGQVSSLTLSNPRYRTLQTNCGSVLLKPNQSCTAKVVVQGDNTNTSVDTQLSFDSQSSQVSVAQVQENLSGQMIALNSAITLGDFYQEGTNKIQVLKIENQGSGTGNIDSSSISLPPGYSVGNNNCANVRPGSSCIVRLVYSSMIQSKGSHTDTVTIGDGDIDLTVNQVTNPNDLQSLNLIVAENIPVGNCSPVSIALKDSENLDYVSSQQINITATATLYSDNSCTTADNMFIAPFESSKNLFIKKQTAGPINLVVTIKSKQETVNLFFYSPLTLTSNKANIVVGQPAQITVGGGRGPFSVETLSGGGTLTVGGTYTSDTVGVANFKVTDTALNQVANVSVNVVSILTSSVASFEKIVSQTQSLQGQNGLPPYTYSKVSGVGAIDSSTGLYASGAAGLVQLKITDSLNQEVLVNGQVYSTLSVTPQSKIIVSTGSHQIMPTGGKLPYSYNKISGNGTVSTTGLFSSAAATTSQIKVADSLGQEQNISIQVVLPLTASISNFEKIVSQTQSIQGQNGLAPYTYSKVSGVGTIDSLGLYSAGAISGSVQLKITDSLNKEVLVNGQVYSQLSVTPLSKIIVSTGSHQISPAGGKSPYVYTKLSGSGNVSPTGVFTSSNETTTQIKVTDALSQEQTVSIQVVLPLTANILTFEKIVGQTLSIQGQNGLAPYTYSKVSGVGLIDSVGLYSAGAVAGPVQLKIVDSLSQEILVDGQVYSLLTVTPLSKTIISTGSHQIYPTGGKSPYSYTKTSGSGTISPSGLFSSATATTALIKVSDSLGQEQTVSIQVVLPLTANVSNFEKIVSQTQSVQGQNGLAPYTYSRVSGVGNIDSSSGLYSAGTVAGAVQLKITDSLNQEVLVNGQVYSQLSISPLSKIIVSSENYQISPTGGKTPYAYTKISGNGTISIGGLFSSATATTTQIKVTDALSQEQTVSIQVVSPLTANISTFEKIVSQTLSIQGQNGLAPYTYSKVSGVGSIDSSTGLYSSGTGAGIVQLKITDSLNQEVLVNGQVYSQLSVNPLLKFIVSTGSHQISPAGGKTPYVYTIMAGDGTISVGGLYSSPTETTAQVKVADALGQEQIVSIQVVLPLIANISTFEKIVNQTQSLQGQKGLAPYTYSKVSGVGTIDSSTGLYSAGAVAGVVQLKIADSLGQEVLVNGQVYSQLNVTPLSKIIISTGSHQIVPTGGKLPYSYTKLSGSGTVVNGLFSSATATTSQIKVSDALGQEQTVSIQVVLPLAANISTFEKIVSQTQSLQGQNGLAPYTYSKVSGVGSIDSSSGLYTAGAVAGVVQLKITDALSQEVLVNGQVYSLVSLSPLNAVVVLSQNQTFTATGGKLPYTYSKVSGVGSIDSASGIYSSVAVGTAQIKVTDALSQEITTGITVNSNLVLSPGTCSYSVPEQVDCTVSATGGIGSKTFSSASGVINSSTGLFYGICSANLGSSLVTVTDSQGNSQSITLSYPCVYKSCNQIKADISGVVSGSFWIDTDANRTGAAPFNVYCDMEQNGGGWILVAKYGNTSNNTYHWFTPSSGTLSLDNSFTSTDIQIATYANAQASAAQKIMVTFNGDKTNNYVVDNLTTYKNRLWSNNPINESLGTLSVAHSSLTGSAYTLGSTVRMHFGTYGGNLGSGLTSGVSANQTLGTISDCPTYCTSRLPGIGAIPSQTANWPLERNPLQVFVQVPYNKYPTGCADALAKGTLNNSGGSGTGFYTIDPDGFNAGAAAYQVYCDMSARTESAIVASGGATTTYTVNGISYRSHTFPQGTTNLIVSQSAPSAIVDTLIVAGGGGGGSSGSIYAGGGGAGGMIVTSFTPSTTSYSMIVGGGGPVQNNGFNSSAFGQTAIGGGYGGSGYGASGNLGGSGGGGAVDNGAPGNGTALQGFAGGWSSGNGTGGNNGGGGGGGAGGRGADIVNGQARNNAGNGGEGLQNSFQTGSLLWYASGGCGSGYYYCSPVNGIGGATNGYIPISPYTNVSSQPLTSGVNGTGSGGGGGRSSAGAAGGSGTVIIRYKFKTF